MPESSKSPHQGPKLSVAETLLLELDRAMRTLHGVERAARPSPAQDLAEPILDKAQRRHSAGLMRVNHCGEVCAQALYRGQALVARRDRIREQLRQAEMQERDHLAWCSARLEELDSRPSRLNPLWYGLSWGLGTLAGLAGDKINLGWLAATEDQVAEHLEDHLQQLPTEDVKSHSIVSTMLEEEREHGTAALAAGGLSFPRPLRRMMRLASKAMTWASYRL